MESCSTYIRACVYVSQCNSPVAPRPISAWFLAFFLLIPYASRSSVVFTCGPSVRRSLPQQRPGSGAGRALPQADGHDARGGFSELPWPGSACPSGYLLVPRRPAPLARIKEGIATGNPDTGTARDARNVTHCNEITIIRDCHE